MNRQLRAFHVIQRVLLARAALNVAILVAALATLSFNATAASLTVNDPSDNVVVDGSCSFREAFLAMNAGADSTDCVHTGFEWGMGDQILFALPGAGPHVLQPLSPLPALTRTVSILGYTQPGASVNTIDGNGSYPAAHGTNAQIAIELDGSMAGQSAYGIELQGNNSRVSGLSIVNFQCGILVNATDTIISGNFIGMRADGVTAAGNAVGVFAVGSRMFLGNGAFSAGPNLIAGNDANVYLRVSQGHWIVSNLIGTDRTGTVGGQCSGTCVGIFVFTGEGLAASNIGIQNNVISGHSTAGILLAGASNINIVGNTIGIAVGGSALGNGHGIIVESLGIQTLATLVSANGIAYSLLGDGVVVQETTSSIAPAGIRIDNLNQIWENTGLGINLRPASEMASSVSGNDPLDADAGPNGMQNRPEIVSATLNATGGVDLTVSVHTSASTSIAIDTWANPSCDPWGAGEGRYGAPGISGNTGTSDAAGNLSLTFTVPAPLPAGWGEGAFVTATARDTSLSNVSEFSDCIVIAAAPGVPPTMGDVPDQAGTVGTPFELDLSSYVTLTDGPIIAGGYAVASGSLPPGLMLDANTGVVSGTPTTAGAYAITVTATDADGTSTADAIGFDIAAAPSADLAVEKTGSDLSIANRYMRYWVRVTNNGPDEAANALILDPLPAELGATNWICTAFNGASCPNASGSGSITETVTLPSGGQLHYELCARVIDGPIIINIAQAVVASTTLDPVSDNDSDEVLTFDPHLFADGFEPHELPLFCPPAD